LRLFKGDICAIKLPNKEGYIYFLYYGGNSGIGYIIKVFDLKSEKLEHDLELIINQKPLFANEYINSYVPHYEEMIVKIGKIKITKEKLKKVKFYDRSSRQSSRFQISKKFKEYLKLPVDYENYEYYDALKEYAKSGKKHLFDDWVVNEYGFIGNKFDFLKENDVGMLSEKERKYMIFGQTYSPSNIIDYYKTGIDRLRAAALVFQ